MWTMVVDAASNGRVNYKQFGQLMGLISQSQNGIDLDVAAVGANTAAPSMKGFNA